MKIAFLGDIALIGRYDLYNNSNADKYLYYLKEQLKNYDYVIGNLESPLTNSRHSLVCKSMHLKSALVNIKLLKELGINAVSLANNHIFDFGDKGVRETIAILEENQIEWFGLKGKTLKKEIKGQYIHISGFCCYSTNGTGYKKLNALTVKNILKQLDTDRKSGAFSILSFHWGLEHTSYPAIEQIRLAERLASEKNVIIHGHHSHTVQPVIQIRNSLCAFSMGNCIFDNCVSLNGKFKVDLNDENRKSFILIVELIDNSIKNYNVFCFYNEKNGLCAYDMDKEWLMPAEEFILNSDKYEKVRLKQYKETIDMKFGPHNLKWLISRLNYYSIGAKLLGKITNLKYEKIKKEF